MTAPAPLVSALIAARHGFFTRQGGVSAGPYASLNASLSGSDDPDKVRQNRALAAQALGADPAKLVGLHQVHGAEVVAVTQAWPPGAGPRADAMVTARPGIALGIVTADCAPVLFEDPGTGIVGAAHAGWRGAAAGVLEATVEAMRALGARPDRIVAAIGPCIGPRSYEVAEDMRACVLAATQALAHCFAPGARPDLYVELRRDGLPVNPAPFLRGRS